MTGTQSMGKKDLLSADPLRINRMLDEIAAISDTPQDQGVTRLAYTEREREAHALVASWFRELGLSVRVDPMGNTIAERPGRAAVGCIATGSHLDSVPMGGRFDGIVGVVAAVEAAHLLVEGGVEHTHPIRFVAFAAEEGARFGQGCIGSKGVGGLWTAQALESMLDANGVSIAAAMRSVGFDPGDLDAARWSPDEWSAFVELHIEQGGQLENRELAIGVVDLISGSTRFEVVIEGTASHTGSTPMDLRADALAAASEVVLIAEEIANDTYHRGTRCTVGRLHVEPGSITTIPGRVAMSVDVRDVDSSRQRDTADEIVRRARKVCNRRGVQMSVHLMSDASPVVLPTWLSDITKRVCEESATSYQVMYSGASHDSQMVNNVVPAGLIFIPSRGGLSHVPDEWSDADDIANGVRVLLNTLLKLDAQLA